MDSLSTLGSHSQYVLTFPYVIRKIVWDGVDVYGSNMFKLTFTKKKTLNFIAGRRPTFHMCSPTKNFYIHQSLKKVEASHVQVSNPELCCKGQSRM